MAMKFSYKPIRADFAARASAHTIGAEVDRRIQLDGSGVDGQFLADCNLLRGLWNFILSFDSAYFSFPKVAGDPLSSVHGHNEDTAPKSARKARPGERDSLSQCPGRTCESRRAFTLTELLVVVAILGIMAALLFPVSKAFMNVGRKTQCLGNLRAIGSLIHLYTQDHDGLLPGPSPNWLSARYVRGNINDPRTLSHYLIPYVDPGIAAGETKLMDVFICPAALSLMTEQETADPRCYTKSGTRKDGVEILRSPFGGRDGVSISYLPSKIQSLENLSQIIAILDRPAPSTNTTGTAHGNSRNVLFLDGHARNVPLSKIRSSTEILD